MDSNHTDTVIQSEQKNLADLLVEQLNLITTERKLETLLSMANIQINALMIDELQLKSILKSQKTGDQSKSTDDLDGDDDVIHVRTNKIDHDNFDEVNRQIISLGTYIKKAEFEFGSEFFESESESEL